VTAGNPHEAFLRQAIALGIRKMNEGCGGPFGDRALPLRQLLAAEGDRALAEWARKPDKTPY
jgi:hypothetical protein